MANITTPSNRDYQGSHDDRLLSWSSKGAHVSKDSLVGERIGERTETVFEYTFENFFHPFVGELITRLNTSPTLAGLFDPEFQHELRADKRKNPDIANEGKPGFFYHNFAYGKPSDNKYITTAAKPKEIDVRTGVPYANYNWEMFFHIPVMIATHLRKV